MWIWVNQSASIMNGYKYNKSFWSFLAMSNANEKRKEKSMFSLENTSESETESLGWMSNVIANYSIKSRPHHRIATAL